MEQESRPSTERADIREYRSGTAPISPEEITALVAASSGAYEPHPKFAGVEVMPMDSKLLPEAIAGLIAERGGSQVSLAAIKVAAEIPEHYHAADGEVYFCGAGGKVALVDELHDAPEEVPLSSDGFTVTMPGEGHGVRADGAAGATLFSAKFIAS